MEDVKDTLWKWFIQLSALIGLGYSTFTALSCLGSLLHPPTMPPDISPDVLRMVQAAMLSMGLLLGPLLGTVWYRMILLRKWAAWVICALGAWLTFMAVAMGSSSEGPHSQLWRALAIAYVLLLGCALICKPKLWNEGL